MKGVVPMQTKKTCELLKIAAVAILLAVLLSGCRPSGPEEAPGVKFAADPEFVEEGGLSALGEAYDFQFGKVYPLAIGLTHEALGAGDVDAAKGNATDGKIKELDLIALKDDKAFFPALNPAPVIREEVLAEYPEIADIMAGIMARLDNQAMIDLNYEVDIELQEPGEAAFQWLLEKGIIPKNPSPLQEGSPVVVGSKDYTEQMVLGQITLLALQSAGIPVLDGTGLGLTEANRNALMAGTIHMYWEYIGTAWNVIFQEEEVLTDSVEAHSLVKERDAENGLVWLDYAPVNNTCAILMRREHAGELGISTISQLARWVKEVQGDG